MQYKTKECETTKQIHKLQSYIKQKSFSRCLSC